MLVLMGVITIHGLHLQHPYARPLGVPWASLGRLLGVPRGQPSLRTRSSFSKNANFHQASVTVKRRAARTGEGIGLRPSPAGETLALVPSLAAISLIKGRGLPYKVFKSLDYFGTASSKMLPKAL
jgi:hypothetical protein